MRPRVWYLLSNTANAAGSRSCNPPAPHPRKTPNCATGDHRGPFLPVPRWWSAECVPWSSGIEHPCNFILDNKLPALLLLGATQNPFGKPPSNVWIQSKPSKSPGGNADTVLRICFCLSLYTCRLLASPSACLVSLLPSKQRKNVHGFPQYHSFHIPHCIPTALASCLPLFLHSSLWFFFLEDLLLTHSSCKSPDTFLFCSVVVFSCWCFVYETRDASKHRRKVWAHNRFRNLHMCLLGILCHFGVLLN